jgi:hypothetical protein
MAINNFHFKKIPEVYLIEEYLKKEGLIRSISKYQLFEHSSYNPAIYIEACGANNEELKFVLRGAPEISGSSLLSSSEALNNELIVMDLLSSIGVEAAKPIFGNRIMIIDYSTSDTKNIFKFIPITYVSGLAVDKALNDQEIDYQEFIIQKIATIYSAVHKIKRNYCGPCILREPESSQNCLDFIYFKKQDLIKFFLSNKYNNVPSKFANDYLRSIDVNEGEIKKIFNENPKLNIPSLVLYDGSAGNMLVDKERIGLIDFDRALYTCPLVEFCGPLYCLERFFFKGSDNDRLWRHFLSTYTSAGGYLPSERDLSVLLKDFMIDYLITSAIDALDHRLELKVKAGMAMIESIHRIINLDNFNCMSPIELIRFIKYKY